jgi:hypothetical protein
MFPHTTLVVRLATTSPPLWFSVRSKILPVRLSQ